MRRAVFLPVLAAGLAATAALGTSADAVPVPTRAVSPLDDPEFTCYLVGTEAAHVPAVDSDDPVTIDLHVLADRTVTTERAAAIVAQSQESYTPLDVVLRVAAVEHVEFSGHDVQDLMAQTKAHVGGARPAGVDAVTLITDQDMTLAVPGAGESNGVAGLADCIGGVRFPEHAFLVAEDAAATVGYPDEGFGFGPVTVSRGLAAKVFGHELGHLLGAQHHYGNCVEGATEVVKGDAGSCTLMLTAAVDLMTFKFGALESTVIRGQAEEFAAS